MKKQKFLYESGECRHKHKWHNNYAEITKDERGRVIGKCPNTLNQKKAQKLLNEGLPYSPATGWRCNYPKEIFNTHEGIPYRAVITRPGNSYHGFPTPTNDVPPILKAELKKRAEKEEKLKEYKKWEKRTKKIPT